MSANFPPFDLCREEGYGALISIDVHGRLLPEEVDLLIAELSAYPDEYGLDYDEERDDWAAPYRGFNIEAAVRFEVEPEEGDGDFTEWHYRPVGSAGVITGDGEVFVTRLVVDDTWRHRCYHHPAQVATTGHPVENFLPQEPDRDPVPVINGYLYMCRDCSTDHTERMKEQTALRAAEVKRRRAAGVPERLVYA